MLVAALLGGLALAASPSASADDVSGRDQPERGTIAGEVVLAPRLSDADTASEYWDVTAWLASGERVVARFLVTNRGPGSRTAAAAGHAVLADGTLLPFQWGRLRDAWKLAPDHSSLKIGKARLTLAGPAVVVSVESPKHGIVFRLEITRASAPMLLPFRDLAYAVEALPPAPVRGVIQGRIVSGTAAVTHTWTEQLESDLLRRRLEVFAGTAELGIYVLDLTLATGKRVGAIRMSRDGRPIAGADDLALDFGSERTAGGDARYPLPAAWAAKSGALALDVTLGRELVRVNPLDLLPQPFRFLLALGGRPQRAWANATAVLTLTPLETKDDTPASRTTLQGIVAATFAGPQ